ncbi:MAG: activator of (R)-2-hydroxyglutaryl-CoA dehydratase [Thiohalomonadaceae bacterium]
MIDRHPGDAPDSACVAAERARLLRAAGLEETPVQHFRRPQERPFTREERAHVTVLLGGLTVAHDRLMRAGLHGLGYRAECIPVPSKADFQTGKEYGNNGQCNPTYFTVGALVNYLIRLRDEQHVPTARILTDYIFVTAGSCGPCRFGMYEAEYRLALRNAGFDGFRVILFDQTGGNEQQTAGGGFEVNPALFLILLNAIFMADVLNAAFFHCRPYETEAGRTQQVMEKCLSICEEAFRTKDHTVHSGLLARLTARLTPVSDPDDVERLFHQMRDDHFLKALERCRALMQGELEVDYTRPRPIVKITGEFWAQTTEGDGNFRMFGFLENEGAEVLVEPVATWIDYTLHDLHLYLKDRRGLDEGGHATRGFAARVQRLRRRLAHLTRELVLSLGEKALAREYDRMRRALGGTVHPLADQLELQRVGHPFYNARATGGEGYLEVAKNIYYYNRDLAHMTLSLKPFGCMPSTQSDGAQAAVVAHYPDMIYLPVETSGEGDINAYSRVQMALGEAKARCKAEFRAALERCGYALEDIRAYVAAHRELRRPLYRVPQVKGVVGRAARFVLHVAARMDKDPDWARRVLRQDPAGALDQADPA